MSGQVQNTIHLNAKLDNIGGLKVRSQFKVGGVYRGTSR